MLFFAMRKTIAETFPPKYCDLKSFYDILKIEKKWYPLHGSVYQDIINLSFPIGVRTMKRVLLALLAVTFLSTGMILPVAEEKTEKKCCKKESKGIKKQHKCCPEKKCCKKEKKECGCKKCCKSCKTRCDGLDECCKKPSCGCCKKSEKKAEVIK